MKKNAFVLLLLVLVLLLVGCNRTDQEPYTVGDRSGNIWVVDPGKRTLTSNGKTYKFKIEGCQDEYVLTIKYPDRNVYTEYKVGDTVEGTYRRNDYNSFFFIDFKTGVIGLPNYSVASADGEQLAKLLHPLIPEEPVQQNHLPSILLIGLGLLDLGWPEVFWIFRYGLAFRDAEFSKRTKIIQALAGFVAIGVGILLLL